MDKKLSRTTTTQGNFVCPNTTLSFLKWSSIVMSHHILNLSLVLLLWMKNLNCDLVPLLLPYIFDFLIFLLLLLFFFHDFFTTVFLFKTVVTMLSLSQSRIYWKQYSFYLHRVGVRSAYTISSSDLTWVITLGLLLLLLSRYIYHASTQKHMNILRS